MVMKTNRLRCNGPEIDPELPTIGFFGDSVTFGQDAQSWGGEVGLSGVQVLNAAVEGMPLEYSAQRFLELKERINLSAVVSRTPPS